MVEPFTYFLPFSQSHIAEKGLSEYHIQIHTDTHFLQGFYDNTKKSYIDVVYNFINEHFDKDIFYQGKIIEPNNHLICLHCKSQNAEQIMKKIVNGLINQFNTNWIKQRIPSLFSIVYNELQNEQYLVKSLSNYQNKNGYETTQFMIDVYFDHIKSHNIFPRQ